MSLTACRECSEPVSSEAPSCPHCGVTAPVAAAEPSPVVLYRRKHRKITVGLVVVGLLAAGTYQVGKSQGWFPTGSIDSTQVAAAVADRYTKIAGTDVTVHCPSIPEQKGKISDCTATRTDTGASTTVFVTQIDAGGHFTFQPEDAAVLITPVDTPAAPDVPAEPEVSPEPELSAADAAKQNDKGWVLESMKAKIDEYNDLGAVARITNRNSTASTAFFTLTFSRAGGIIATLHGVVNSVAAGQTVTVDFSSTDHIDTRTFTYQFQTDTSLPL